MDHTNTSVFRVKPQDFASAVGVSACYIESNEKLLFLKRATQKPEGGKWGVPGGKIEGGESPLEAAVRETFEETGILIKEEQLKCIGTVFIRKPNVDYVYHMYYVSFRQFPTVSLNNEHQDHRWVSEKECANLPLVAGGIEVLYHMKDLREAGSQKEHLI